MSALNAVIIPIGVIMKTLWLALLFMYCFTVVGFAQLHDHYNEGERKEDNMCNSIAQCYLFTAYNGVISSENWAALGPADLWPSTPYSVKQDFEIRKHTWFLLRFGYDIAFFILIGVVLIGGALFGIILDKFGEIRSEQDDIADQQENKCFICMRKSEEFERDGASFETHVKEDHYMWSYINFMVYLKELPSTELNGAESFVLGKLKEDGAGVDWLPRGHAMVLNKQEKADDSNDDKANLETLDSVQTDLAALKRSQIFMKTMMEEALQAAKNADAGPWK